MKQDTKYAIIVYGFLAVIVGLIFWGIFTWIINDNNKFNICAEEYGYGIANFWSWEGTSNMNYTYRFFNGTHIACCKEGKFLNPNGQIQDLNCTSLLKKGEKKNE